MYPIENDLPTTAVEDRQTDRHLAHSERAPSKTRAASRIHALDSCAQGITIFIGA
jgi:hypothetical protein